MVTKGKKELIQEKAKASGESLNAFINRATAIKIKSKTDFTASVE
ncbi:MAG: hypothetical protein SPL89_05060 [Clostridia bacterium]|nr:hypothetical protein [Clostridia bacterium]